MIKKLSVVLVVVMSLASSFSLANSEALWAQDALEFAQRKLVSLRESRINVVRDIPSIILGIEVLNFLQSSCSKYGVGLVSASTQGAQLMVDFSDIVNLQHPGFKNRFDIVIQQHAKKGVQVPFSFHAFDRIAQVFHCQDTLFDRSEGSYYGQITSLIFDLELPKLARAMNFIVELEAQRGRLPFPKSQRQRGYGTIDARHLLYLEAMNTLLDQISRAHGSKKKQLETMFRQRSYNCALPNLRTLTSMAHDFLNLERLEDTLKKASSSVKEFNVPAEREAFLAFAIQVGELATNKNASSFVRSKSLRMPWQTLVDIRDAIEHQDENGFNLVFEGLVDGTNSVIDFKKWAKEFERMHDEVKALRGRIWSEPTPGDAFEVWIREELNGTPIYGVRTVVPRVALSKPQRKAFAKTDLYKGDKATWSTLLTAQRLIELSHLRDLDPHNVDHQPVRAYLLQRLKQEAVHLEEDEKNFLVQTLEAHMANGPIASMMIALLTKDRSYFAQANTAAAAHEIVGAGVDFSRYTTIYSKVMPLGSVSETLRAHLSRDSSKDLSQTERKSLFSAMMSRTGTHLHNLAHDKVFEGHLYDKMSVLPIQYMFTKAAERDSEFAMFSDRLSKIVEDTSAPNEYGYLISTRHGQRLFCEELIRNIHLVGKVWELTEEERAPEAVQAFSKEVMDDFYRKAHAATLKQAILKNPVVHMASVYSLSVAFGALKGWVEHNGSKHLSEAVTLEKVRVNRNFLAHGDLLRTMHDVDIHHVQEHLLSEVYETENGVGWHQGEGA